MSDTAAQHRLDWVDAAKGLCIIMVVIMHSTLGVEKDLGQLTWLHTLVDWARPFRMPDFFLISGLFLAARIDRPWRSYFETKVAHFAYFYLLWFHIHFFLRLRGTISEVGVEGALWLYAEAYFDPFGSLWFIYLLAVYFLVAKLVHRAPKSLVLTAGVVMHAFAPHTGIFLVDEFMNRFVFFYTGYACAPAIFALAHHALQLRLPVLLIILGMWATINTFAVSTGASQWAGLDLVVSGFGIGGVVVFSVLVTAPAARHSLRSYLGPALLYCGRHSIVIYLAFTIFMAATRVLLIKIAPGLDGGMISLASAAAGLGGSLLLHLWVRRTRLAFLFERPAWTARWLGHAPYKVSIGGGPVPSGRA